MGAKTIFISNYLVVQLTSVICYRKVAYYSKVAFYRKIAYSQIVYKNLCDGVLSKVSLPFNITGYD